MSFEVWVVGIPLLVICFHVIFFPVSLVGMPLLVICFHVIFFQQQDLEVLVCCPRQSLQQGYFLPVWQQVYPFLYRTYGEIL
ncbi:hypothetical protein CY35_10G087900 [Sphagnum magellanicum]|nr:hypothetical protein CY35_10G087900 [Sphagnum magellanicum]